MGLYPTIWQSVERTAPRYLLRLAIIGNLLHDLPTTTESILEVGPGRGDVSSHLAAIRPNASVTLCESSAIAREHLEERFSTHSQITITPTLNDLKADTYDAVMAFEVLEHIENDHQFMRDLVRVLKPGGQLVISVPAYMSKWQRQDEWAGHVRRYEYDELQQLLLAANIQPTTHVDFGFPLMSAIAPLKFLYYRRSKQGADDSTNQDRTATSGVNRSTTVSLISTVVKPIVWLGVVLQRPFKNKRLGDGFVVIGTRRA